MSTKVTVAPVRSEDEYQVALRRIDELFESPEGTPEFDEFDILTILVHEYEKTHFSIASQDPPASLRHFLDRMNLTSKDLEPHIGTKSMVSMVLNGRRPLTVRMIRNLHEAFNIPLEFLIGCPM